MNITTLSAHLVPENRHWFRKLVSQVSTFSQLWATCYIWHTLGQAQFSSNLSVKVPVFLNIVRGSFPPCSRVEHSKVFKVFKAKFPFISPFKSDSLTQSPWFEVGCQFHKFLQHDLRIRVCIDVSFFFHH
jgi:hypothetical protein